MKTKMLALFAVLVLSVALAGTAYAAWTTSVTINGAVKTGQVGLTIAATGVSTPAGYLLVTPNTPSSSVSFALGSDASGVYPGVTGTATITLTNTGTVPLKLSAPALSGTNAADVSMDGTKAINYTPDVYTPAGGETLAVGASLTFTATFTVTDHAAQNTNYAFVVTFNAQTP